MRLLLKLMAVKEQNTTDYQLYHKLQGFVYKLLKESKFNDIHSKKGYRFFCYSNIFPSGVMKKDDVRNFIISSPSEAIMKSVAERLESKIGTTLNFGEMQFTLKDIQLFSIMMKNENLHIKSATPIVIRIPEQNYDIYEIPLEERKHRYVYWRAKYSFEAFVKQLSENLIKKYNDFYGTKIENYNLFEQFVFNKSVTVRIVVHGQSYPVVGSLWEFMWSYMDNTQRRIIEFGVDTGFGERNSYGFGFVNVER